MRLTLRECSLALRKVILQPDINLFVTYALIIMSLYPAFVSVAGVPVFDPFAKTVQSSFSFGFVIQEMLHSSLSLFFLTITALLVGRLAEFVLLPSFIGFLLVGVVISNNDYLNELCFINKYWDFILRRMALVFIITRWGLSLNFDGMRRNLKVACMIGFGSSSLEIIAILLFCTLYHGFSFPMAFVGAFLLTTASPAVNGPILADWKKRQIMTTKDVPDLIIAACSLDNFFTIGTFSGASAILFSKNDYLTTIAYLFLEIGVSILVGWCIGHTLWWFPRSDAAYTHLARGIMLLSVNSAFIIGMTQVGPTYCGILAALFTSYYSAQKWRQDNSKQTAPMERSFTNIWNILMMPLLFSLMGRKLSFAEISANDAFVAVSIILTGVIVRYISIMIITRFTTDFSFKEQLVVALTMIPRATVQAALGPNMAINAAKFGDLYEKEVAVLSNAAILTILITTPLVNWSLRIFGPKVLGDSSKEKNIKMFAEDNFSTISISGGECRATNCAFSQTVVDRASLPQ